MGHFHSKASERSAARFSWFRGLRLAVLIYAGLLAVVLFAQRQFIYYPQRVPLATLKVEAERLDFELWESEDDRYQGWMARNQAGSGRLVIFHGNAGHALGRAYFIEAFRGLGKAGFAEIYIFEYPGYGARSGKPGERRILEAARQALQPLASDRSEEPLYLLGESLGSGPASRLAAEWPERIEGLLLITPFPSLAAVGQKHFPFLPVGLLLRDRYENAKHLEAYSGRVFFLLTEEDEVIPAELGRELHDRYDGPKRLHVVEGAGHNTILSRMTKERWREIVEFLKANPSSTGSKPEARRNISKALL